MRVDTRALAEAAEVRGISWTYLGDFHLRLVRDDRERRLYRTYTDRTTHLGWVIARDKVHTNRVLRDAGLPLPRQAVVASAVEAVARAAELACPVVVKPRSADNGVGVTVGITDSDEIEAAFHEAARHEEGVILEEHIAGDDCRLLVVGDRMVASVNREAAHVTGDGTHSVAELMDEANADPLRQEGPEMLLRPFVFDGDSRSVLARQGHTADSVPEAGERVYLRTAGNLSLGGSAADVTDIVHPDNHELAVRAARAVGLDVAGVDFITTDISRSYRETHGGICEVNPTPGIRMHLWPSEGESRDVAGDIIEFLFPPPVHPR